MALGIPPPRVTVRSLGDEAPVRYVEAVLPPNSTAAADAMLALLEREAQEFGAVASAEPVPA